MTVVRTDAEDRAIIRAWWDAENRGDITEANRLFRYVHDICWAGGPALPDNMQQAVDEIRESKRAAAKPAKRRR